MADSATDLRVERKPKLSETVVAAIRKQLLAGEIPPGHKLPTEGQLTLEFSDKPLTIRNMIVRDATNQVTTVSLNNARFGMQLHARALRNPRESGTAPTVLRMRASSAS